MRKKTGLMMVAFILLGCSMQAQTKLSKVLEQASLGGYAVVKDTYTDESSVDAKSNFSVRMVRFYVNGTLGSDWKYKAQMEFSGEPGTNKGVRLLDAYAEWGKYKAIAVRVGQMKRAFSFENPYSPWAVGHTNYSMVVRNLVAFSDRAGEQPSGGRDLGVLIKGDLFPLTTHRFLHYELGLYNGEGINHADRNNSKDIIGGISIRPLKELQLGVFGWNGEYGTEQNKVTRRRMAFGVKYESKWSARAEYITSKGGVFMHPEMSDRADGWYATVGIPVCKKLKIYPRWDVYRQEKTNDTKTENFGVTFNYTVYKNLMLQAAYYYSNQRVATYSNNVRSTTDVNSNHLAAELYIRF